MANEEGAEGDQRWRIHGRPTCHGVHTQFSIFYNLYRINGIITQLQSPLQLRDPELRDTLSEKIKWPYVS